MRPCIQQHIPRTAGTSITHSLNLRKLYDPKKFEEPKSLGLRRFGNFSLGHILLSSIPNYSWFINYYFIFTFVRNPYDRMVSLYHHYKRQLKPNNFLDFCKFVHIYWKQNRIDPIGFYNRQGLNQLNSQVDWIWDKNGNSQIHFIGRYENLGPDFRILCRLLSIEPPELPHEHETKGIPPYITHYQMYPECIDLVYEIYKKDFLMLEYTKLYIEKEN